MLRQCLWQLLEASNVLSQFWLMKLPEKAYQKAIQRLQTEQVLYLRAIRAGKATGMQSNNAATLGELERSKQAEKKATTIGTGTTRNPFSQK